MSSHRFGSFGDVEKWLDVVAAADTVTADGEYTPGQALSHCAQSLEMQRTGFPEMKPPIIRATIGRIARTVFLRKGTMSHSTDAPIPGASVGEVSTVHGVTELRNAIASFRSHDGPIAEHFMFGSVDRSTAERLQSMHVANHADTFSLS